MSNNSSLIDLVLQSDYIIQFIFLILFLWSAYSWAIVFQKYLLLSKVSKHILEFEKLFNSGVSLENLILKSKNTDFDYPHKRLLSKVILELDRGNTELRKQNESITKIYSQSNIKERIVNSIDAEIQNQQELLEKDLDKLGIIGSITPFIGLFGTVWGIMSSFQNIALMNNVALNTVAPGIAEALLATALGLFVAIPAVFFYNIFVAKINNIISSAQNFGSEILNIILMQL